MSWSPSSSVSAAPPPAEPPTAWTACHTLALDDAPSRVCSSCAPSRVCSNCCEEIISGGEGDGGGGRRHACKQLACVQVVEARLGRGPGARVVGRVIGRGTSSAVAWAHGSDGVHCVSPGDLPTWWTSVELRRARAERRQLRHARAAACERAADRDGAVAGGTRVPLLGTTFGEAATLRFRFEVSGDRRRSLCLWAARRSCARRRRRVTLDATCASACGGGVGGVSDGVDGGGGMIAGDGVGGED